MTGFVLRTLLLLPLAFIAWYLAADLVAQPAAWLTRWLLLGAFPRIAADFQSEGHTLVLHTQFLAVQHAHGLVTYPATSFTLDALVYTSGRPLFIALTLAAGGRHMLRNLFIGMALLTLSETWGLGFGLLAQVADMMQQSFDAARWNFIALGHQLGVLLMPTVLPLGLWAWFHFDGGRIRLHPRAPSPSAAGSSC